MRSDERAQLIALVVMVGVWAPLAYIFGVSNGFAYGLCVFFWLSVTSAAISIVPAYIAGWGSSRRNRWVILSVGGTVFWTIAIGYTVQQMPGIIALDPSEALRLPGPFFWFTWKIIHPVFSVWNALILAAVAVHLYKLADWLGPERAEQMSGSLQSVGFFLIAWAFAHHSVEGVGQWLNYIGAAFGVLGGVLRLRRPFLRPTPSDILRVPFMC